jgi:4-hydroxybenzoate polyprenyltransferase
MLNRFLTYCRFVKIEHTLFSLPLLFSGAYLASGRLPDARLSLLIIGAGLGARAAAFAINRIIDRNIDKRNPRTSHRELPRGFMNLAEAWAVCLAGVIVYEICAWSIAPVCFRLSPLPLAVFAGYPYLKRFTALSHFGIGLADALAPLGGWIAVTKALYPVWPGLLLGAFTFFWVSGFDIIYATMDEEFDVREGLHSLPAYLGSKTALKVSAVLHLLAFASLVILYERQFRSPLAFVTLTAIGVLLIAEQVAAYEDAELAFFRINAVLGFGVLGLVAAGSVI